MKTLLILTFAFFTIQLSAQQAGRIVKRPSVNTKEKSSTNYDNNAYKVGRLEVPTAPSAVDIKERTIKDLLYYPFGCLEHVEQESDAKNGLQSIFGKVESNYRYVQIRHGDTYSFTYRNHPIGLCQWRLFDGQKQTFYYFYFDTYATGQRFFEQLSKDIVKAGIPLTKDKVYGGMSNRKHPVANFYWVYVDLPVKIKETTNEHTQDVVGKYFVLLGIYKR